MVFSQKTYTTVGIGGIYKKNNNIVDIFKNFAESNNKDLVNIKGAYIPYGKYPTVPYKDNIFLIGDAAGSVDPITGEGIYFALLSAKYLFQSLTKENIQLIGTEYLLKIQNIHHWIEGANKARDIFFNKMIQTIIFKLLNGHRNVVTYILDNTISNDIIPYNSLFLNYFL